MEEKFLKTPNSKRSSKLQNSRKTLKCLCRSSALAEFFGFFGGGADGADRGGAEFSFFEFVQAFDGCAARARDHVFERARMQAGVEDHFGAAKDGLGREFCGDIARQTRGDAAVAQGFDEKINVGGTAAAQAGDGVEQVFFELENSADGREKFLREIGVLRLR